MNENENAQRLLRLLECDQFEEGGFPKSRKRSAVEKRKGIQWGNFRLCMKKERSVNKCTTGKEQYDRNQPDTTSFPKITRMVSQSDRLCRCRAAATTNPKQVLADVLRK